ncbi:hypothetical protein YC2023_041057 [Brassica napus]|uniref:Uncharacterized protein n=1 Tax=Brassica oleracea TaxID=3712 RepID=A0A3P6G2L3_BRAOL|nr:unnamed protein product [Brassica oleracea]
MVQSPLMFAPQPPTQSSLHPVKRSLSLFPCAEKETIVYYSSSAYPKQDMFLLLNPWGEDDFTKTHLQQVLKLYSKELPDKNYASNTRKQSTFLERCISKCKYCSLVLKSRAFTGHRNTISSLLFRHTTAELYSGSFDRSVKECTYGWER